jgi:glutaredoxin 2
MKLKLYHYIHCPYCVRVRLALGYLQIEYDSIVLPYDDEKTPQQLCGAKMLPILMKSDGSHINESLDIIKYLDQENQLGGSLNQEDFLQAENYLTEISKNIFYLCMPAWVNSPEFSPSAKAYFLKKKEAKRGPFNELHLKRDYYIDQVRNDLEELENMLHPFFMSSEFTTLDIMLAAQLWGLFVVPEFQFSDPLYRYLMTVKNICSFDYHSDYWTNPYFYQKSEK